MRNRAQLFDFPYGLREELDKEVALGNRSLQICSVSTAVQVDIIALFHASWLARYRPKQWQKVLEGKESKDRAHFESVFERYVDSVDEFLDVLRAPRRGLDFESYFFAKDFGKSE